MIHSKKEALTKIKETIEILNKAEYSLIMLGACWEKLDKEDKERINCTNFSTKISNITEHLKLIE